MAALQMRANLVEDVGEPEADRIIGEGLKGAYEAAGGHSRPWRYYCDDCRDTGWVRVEEDASIVYGPGAKTTRAYHCTACHYWQRERKKALERQERNEADPFIAAGKGRR